MTIKYKFVTGEEVYVEVYGRFEKVMAKMELTSRLESNSDAMKHCMDFSEKIIGSNSNPGNNTF